MNEYSFSNLWFDEINKLFTHANSSRISQINEISEEKIGKPTAYNRNFMMATVLYLVLETKKVHKETDNNIDRYKNTISSIITNFKNDSQIIDYDDNLSAIDPIMDGYLIEAKREIIKIVVNRNHAMYTDYLAHLDADGISPIFAMMYCHFKSREKSLVGIQSEESRW